VSNIIADNTAVDTKEFDRLVASTVQAMRQSLGVTVDELARASGVSCLSIEAIERGGATTHAERHDIADAVGWLANNCVARELTTRPEAVTPLEG
jgi:transcriptional regulator with XRE-family HTH domain